MHPDITDNDFMTDQKRSVEPRAGRTSGTASEPPRRGLFDGFEGYRTPSEDDYRRVLNEGLVAPDTNVLLNLYRYNATTQADLFAVLDRLGERLWVPHQVLVEFWRNRESALRDPQDTAETAIEALKDQCEQAIRVLRTWANRIALPTDRLANLQEALEKNFTLVNDAIAELVDAEAGEQARDTSTDPVLRKLELVLKGRVGPALDAEAYAEAVTEGQRRVAAELPPGYLDAKKNKGKVTEGAAGDYLVWEQVLREAERRHCDVLLVTGDIKDDWWRKDRSQTRGPRLELVEEMRSRAGVRLFMLRPESLLIHARQVLAVNVREESVQDVERVDRFLAAGESGGWTAETLQELLDRLSTRGSVQAAVIQQAAKSGGFVKREVVYELGSYDETRTLKGFTRPANRLAQEFRERGIVPDSAVDILEAVYDPSNNWGIASGFRIPQELIPLIPD
jgi:predicted nucleic-acid-binding protein